MTDPPVIAEVVTPSIGTGHSPQTGVTTTVHRKPPHAVSSKRSRRSYMDTSTFPGTSGILCLLVRCLDTVVEVCHLRYHGDINGLVARSLVKGLLRYNYETRSTIAMALETPWIDCDLDALEKAYRERVSLN
jgi:hypothetical protein